MKTSIALTSADARARGPVVCSRIKSNLPIRNSIGAHAGSYSIYRALSIAMGQLRPDWRPDLTNTHVSFECFGLTDYSPPLSSLPAQDGSVMVLDEARKATTKHGRLSLSIHGVPCHRKSGPRWVQALNVLTLGICRRPGRQTDHLPDQSSYQD